MPEPPEFPAIANKKAATCARATCARANNNDAKLVHSGAAVLVKFAKIRLQELAESGCAEFDSLYTRRLERGDLCRLLWLTTGVRPNDKTFSFRAKNYKELREQCKVVKDRAAKRMGQEQFDRMVQQLVYPPSPKFNALLRTGVR